MSNPEKFNLNVNRATEARNLSESEIQETQNVLDKMKPELQEAITKHPAFESEIESAASLDQILAAAEKYAVPDSDFEGKMAMHSEPGKSFDVPFSLDDFKAGIEQLKNPSNDLPEGVNFRGINEDTWNRFNRVLRDIPSVREAIERLVPLDSLPKAIQQEWPKGA
jgi:hypothetical protein